MQRLLATALAATLALGTLAAPALADGHGHGHGNGHDRAVAHRASSHDAHRQNQNGDGDDEDGRGPHGCVNPAGNVRGWCKHGTPGNGSYNGYPTNGSGGYANQQVSGLVTAVSGNRVTILVGLRSVNVDTSQAYRNGRAVNVGIGSSITAYGYYGNDNTFYATQIS